MLTLASYNIRKCVGLDWKRNPDRIQAILGEMDADIVLLQEADKRLQPRPGTLSADSLWRELGYRFVEVADNAVSHGWHGNAILYREPLQVIHTKRIAIPTVEPRGAVAAVLRLPNGQHLQVIGTHLSLLRKMRAKQIDFLLQSVAQQNPAYPTLIGGDLNEKNAEKWFIDNPLSEPFRLITPGASFHSSKPILKFDRFIVSEAIHVDSARVHRSPLSARGSDHLPVIMDFSVL